MSPELLSWIEQQKPELVAAAEGYVNKTGIAKSGGGAKEVTRSQLRNLLSAALAQSPLAVIVNLLRYQIGRKDRGWKDTASGRELEDLLTREVGARVVNAPAGKDRYAAESRLAALLLGYLVREFTFRCEVGDKPWQSAAS